MFNLATVKRHLVIDDVIVGDTDDALIKSYMLAAIAAAENETSSYIAQRPVVQYADAFEVCFDLVSRVQSVEKIVYVDHAGREQTLQDDTVYMLSKAAIKQTLYLAYGARMPCALRVPNAVSIHYTAGFPADAMPADLELALMILVGHMYENREPVSAVQLHEVPMSYQTLISPFVRVRA